MASDAQALAVADVGLHADASRFAFDFLAFLRDLRRTVDHVRQRRTAAGQAVQLGSDWVVNVGLAVGRAFVDWFRCHGDRGAVGSSHAFALVVLQESFLAEASNDAVLGAHWAWVWVGAGGRAGGSAGVEHLVLTALVWWQHHERRSFNSRAFFLGHAAAVAVTQVSLLAGATRDADARADGVGLGAGAVATFALAPFLVLTADSRRQGHGFRGWNAALFRGDAFAFLVLQVAGFAEAANDALERADGRVGLGAGRWAGGAAWHENFVLLALRHFRRVGEEHGRLVGIAFVGRHADSLRVTQVAWLAEASDDALTGADWAGFRVGAGGRASSTAWVEFFVRRAFRDLRHAHGHGHGNIVVGLGIALFRAHAFTVGVLQVSGFTETPADTLEGTDVIGLRVRAVRNAGGSACQVFGIRTALSRLIDGERRDGDSEPEGTNAEQQRESKARVHR